MSEFQSEQHDDSCEICEAPYAEYDDRNARYLCAHCAFEIDFPIVDGEEEV